MKGRTLAGLGLALAAGCGVFLANTCGDYRPPEGVMCTGQARHLFLRIWEATKLKDGQLIDIGDIADSFPGLAFCPESGARYWVRRDVAAWEQAMSEHADSIYVVCPTAHGRGEWTFHITIRSEGQCLEIKPEEFLTIRKEDFLRDADRMSTGDE